MLELSQDMLNSRPASARELDCPCLPTGHCSKQFGTGEGHEADPMAKSKARRAKSQKKGGRGKRE